MGGGWGGGAWRHAIKNAFRNTFMSCLLLSRTNGWATGRGASDLRRHNVKPYNSPPGYYAWRNDKNGSWFVQALCKVFGKWGKSLEIMQLMTRVNNQVAFQFESNPRERSGMKQMPDVSTRLIKELYFQQNEWID